MKISKLMRGSFATATLILTLSACATMAPQSPRSDSVNASRQAPGTLAITGDQLVQSGRTNTADALRALSPLFY